MAYMSARTSLFLGRENLDAIIAIVCLKMPCILVESMTESLRCFLVMLKIFMDNNFRGVYYFYYYYHEYYCCYHHYRYYYYYYYYYIIIIIIIASLLLLLSSIIIFLLNCSLFLTHELL